MEVANARRVQIGQETKMEIVSDGAEVPPPRRGDRRAFSEMQADLNREKKAMTRLWAKREAQIQGVIISTVGMYGDLQGIAGRAAGDQASRSALARGRNRMPG